MHSVCVFGECCVWHFFVVWYGGFGRGEGGGIERDEKREQKWG